MFNCIANCVTVQFIKVFSVSHHESGSRILAWSIAFVAGDSRSLVAAFIILTDPYRRFHGIKWAAYL